jgi:hypothetical protein
MDLIFSGGLTISSGITVGASKETAIGDIECRDSLETTKMGWSEDLSLPQSWKNFVMIQTIQPLESIEL